MEKPNPEMQYDCIIIGAGLYGLAAANAYLSVHPHKRLVILESRPCIGGVWSHERVYDEFWTQTPVDMASFSSLPIKSPPQNQTYYDFFPARYVAHYLDDYVNQKVYCGHSIRSRIRFGSNVVKAEFTAVTRVWKIFCEGEFRPLMSPELLVAAGLTSRPNIPQLPGQQGFKGTFIHHIDFGKSSLMGDPNINHIAVLGGAKSAADIAYAAAKNGKRVSWVVRKNGNGPAHLAPAQGMGPYKNSNELLYTRLAASLTPSIWNPSSWLQSLLHRTSIGRKVVDMIWQRFDAHSRKDAGFGREPNGDESENGFGNLEPETSIFWQNDSTGVNQRPDFWDTISTKAHVYRQDIVRLTKDSIVLTKDEIPDVDAIICATGWRPSYETFFDTSLALDLGLAVPRDRIPAEHDSPSWKSEDDAAEATVAQLFPRLQHPPSHNASTNISTGTDNLTPFRLYRNLIPPQREKYPGIVFLGHIAVGNNFRAAEVQALWAVAYLSGTLWKTPTPNPNPEPDESDPKTPSSSSPPRPSIPPTRAQMNREISLHLAWCRRRYLTKGQLGHWLYYDLVPYTDTLLAELGLSSHLRHGRHGRGGGVRARLADFWKRARRRI